MKKTGESLSLQDKIFKNFGPPSFAIEENDIISIKSGANVIIETRRVFLQVGHGEEVAFENGEKYYLNKSDALIAQQESISRQIDKIDEFKERYISIQIKYKKEQDEEENR